MIFIGIQLEIIQNMNEKIEHCYIVIKIIQFFSPGNAEVEREYIQEKSLIAHRLVHPAI